MPRKSRTPSAGWTQGQLLGAVAMAQSNMKRIVHVHHHAGVRERANHIYNLLTSLSIALKAEAKERSNSTPPF